MRLSATLSGYLVRQYLFGFGVMFAVLTVLVFTFDTIELLRRAAGRPDAHFTIVVGMALLRLPGLASKVLPFAALFGAMLTLTRLTRTHELTVSRATGVSVWQFLAPGLALALAIGIFAIAAYNPLAAALAARYAELEAKLLRGRVSLLAVSPSGLWLRDADSEGQVVIHALRVMRDGVELDDAIFLYYSGADRFARRIDAATARLGNGQWELEDALVTGPDRGAEIHARLTLPTTLTLARIQDSFVPPETMSFWALPAFIETLEKAGFSALRHRLHFLSTLAIPFLLCAMVLVAATVSLRLTRRGGVGWMLAAGVLAGFLFYFLSDLTLALGMAGSIPAHLAAFSPTAVTALLGIALLFHLEDG